MAFRGSRLLGLAVVGVALSTGCGNGATEGPRAATGLFERAWSSQDGSAVCRLLAPETRTDVAMNAEAPCEEAVLEADLPDAAPVRSIQVWGGAAQVRTGNDALFLAEFPAGWLVVAAGCRPRPGKPYECQVKGG